MSFKNKHGEVSWYVVTLIMALVILVVSLFVVPLIKNAQAQSGKPLTDACGIVGGACQQVQVSNGPDGKPDTANAACTTGTKIPALCPDKDKLPHEGGLRIKPSHVAVEAMRARDDG